MEKKTNNPKLEHLKFLRKSVLSIKLKVIMPYMQIL